VGVLVLRHLHQQSCDEEDYFLSCRLLDADYRNEVRLTPSSESVEMATLEQGNGLLKHLSLTGVESKFPTTVWHRTDRAQPLLIIIIIIVAFQSSPLNNNPSSTAGIYHARAQNAIHHSEIIKVIEAESAGQYWFSVFEESRHTLGAQKSHQSL
jgi:hypothetical protein